MAVGQLEVDLRSVAGPSRSNLVLANTPLALFVEPLALEHGSSSLRPSQPTLSLKWLNVFSPGDAMVRPPPSPPPRAHAQSVYAPLGDSVGCPPCTVNVAAGVVHIELRGKLDEEQPEMLEIWAAGYLIQSFEVDASNLDKDYEIPIHLNHVVIRVKVASGATPIITYTPIIES